ncbi:hypothetical protein ACFQU2_37145 [Siccirubricoccus deserti]|uniref:Uncharacterized protein n=1 Tax=Siccirubricoccus deserti TaxID=2013562 RepID=A0A9X0R514_9PROT|nr:hypothetical protein [Siccirubricoccus deserti]MBC4018663.1 hypothetical protein [Siccirubricoccus deserti]
MTKRGTNQQQSRAALLDKKAKFDALLAALQHVSADHLGADHDGTGAAEEGWRGPTQVFRTASGSPVRIATAVRILPGTPRGDYRSTKMRECAAKAGDIGRLHIGRF